MAKNSASFDAKVEVLRHAFMAKLVTYCRELADLLRHLTADSLPHDNYATLEKITTLLHQLKGTSGSFALREISLLVTSMEQQAMVARDQESALSQAAIDGLWQQLDALSSASDADKNTKITPDSMWHAPVTGNEDTTTFSKTLVIVDDDADLVRLLQIQLARFGFEVIALSDHRELAPAMRRYNPLALIMDVSFLDDVEAGLKAVQGLRKRELITCPVLFLSAKGDLVSRLSAIRAGCDGYICKPVNITDLVEIISHVSEAHISSRYRVLLIDDDPEEASLNALLLEAAGIQTQVVTQPLDTMAHMHELEPDVVLMDISMPECNGFELAAAIRQHSQYTQVPIIFLTASDMQDDWLRSVQAGGDEYLRKNISHAELVASVLARATRSRQLSTMVKRLRLSENRFRSVSASARDAIITSNTENRIVTWNLGAQKLFGYIEAEILGSDLSRLFTDSDAKLVRGDFETIEMVGIKKDASETPVEVSMAIWQVDDTSFSTVIIRDMVRRKRYEKSINDARQVAENANQAKSQFLAAMSHELRTPLHGILGFSQMLEQNQAEPLSKLQLKCVNHVRNSGHHLLTLIDEVLDLAKIEAGKVEIVLEDIAIHALLDECIELAQPLATEYLVTIHTPTISDVPPPRIRADTARTKQVLLNLLSNAAKYNRPHGEVSVACKPVSNKMLRISVTDTGIGIAEEKWPDLFTPFSRLGAETGEIPGTGIGLSVTKNLMELMAGRIGFESVQGHGSTFWFELPLSLKKPARAAPSRQRHHNRPDYEFPVIQGTLLYVEDNRANLALMKMLVQNIPGLVLISAMTAEQGVEMAKEFLPDVIILDLHLPGMDGYEAFTILQQSPTQHIPVMAISADASGEDIARGLGAGFCSYLTKPIDVYEVADAINSVLPGA